MQKKLIYLIQSALIAALYLVLTTFIFQPLSFLPVQLRIAEALMVLPILTPAGIPGLFIGCFLANMTNPSNLGPVDIVLGSVATGAAAILTRYAAAKLQPKGRIALKNAKAWVLLGPTVLLNALIVGSYLPFLLTDPAKMNLPLLLASIATVAAGELAVMLILGLPLLLGLQRTGLFDDTMAGMR